MKITITVDANPNEVREALGLPNMKDIQKEILEQISKRIQTENLDIGSLMEILDPRKTYQMGKKMVESAFNGLTSFVKDSKDS
ncbi:hypothetical protein WDW89_13040 [Deltaproteobacteria bacterium TL4]